MFEQLKQIQTILSIIADIQKMDADKSGKPDIQEIIGKIFLLKDQAEEARAKVEVCMLTLQQLGEIAGKDVDEIRERLGIKKDA